MKFSRTWTGIIDGFDSEITMGYPLTIEINVVRSVLATANTGTFLIYNLGQETRNILFKDRFTGTLDRRITIMAGYEQEPKLPTIFQGNIVSCYSYRRGPNWITEIEAMDGIYGIQNGQVDQTFPIPYDIKNVVKEIIGTMPGIIEGAIGAIESQNNRGITASGNSWDILHKIVKDATPFIDNGRANILKGNEYIQEGGLLDVINSETGILETPRRFDARLDVQVLFTPQMIVGQKVKLQTEDGVYNGDFIVKGVSHRATISGAVGGPAITTLNFTHAEAFGNVVAVSA